MYMYNTLYIFRVNFILKILFLSECFDIFDIMGFMSGIVEKVEHQIHHLLGEDVLHVGLLFHFFFFFGVVDKLLTT